MRLKRKIVLDTCVLVDFLRGHRKAVSFVVSNQDQALVSPIVLAELHAGARDEEEVAELVRLSSLFASAEVSLEVAALTGELMRTYSKSHRLGLADAMLAATAISHEALIKTLNVKHFPMFPGLKPAY